jgi:hypothetical protein
MFLQLEQLWGLDDPLFPKTHIANGRNRLFEASGLARECWSNAGPIRTIFRKAFEAAGLPYYNPHSFRKTLARLGHAVCRTLEQHKAWSQNLGHDDIRTTLVSYGTMPAVRQAELIRELGMPRASGEEIADGPTPCGCDRSGARVRQIVVRIRISTPISRTLLPPRFPQKVRGQRMNLAPSQVIDVS